jgi:hypothetical protein
MAASSSKVCPVYQGSRRSHRCENPQMAGMLKDSLMDWILEEMYNAGQKNSADMKLKQAHIILG